MDIASFETMWTENYLYMDKTLHIYRMVTEGRYYFFVAPATFWEDEAEQCLKT